MPNVIVRPQRTCDCAFCVFRIQDSPKVWTDCTSCVQQTTTRRRLQILARHRSPTTPCTPLVLRAGSTHAHECRLSSCIACVAHCSTLTPSSVGNECKVFYTHIVSILLRGMFIQTIALPKIASNAISACTCAK